MKYALVLMLLAFPAVADNPVSVQVACYKDKILIHIVATGPADGVISIPANVCGQNI